MFYETIPSCPFDAWGLDVLGPLLKSSDGHLYILDATDYFLKWVETVASKEVKKENVSKFILVIIIYIFGIPCYIITDNIKPFDNKLMNNICDLFFLSNVNLVCIMLPPMVLMKHSIRPYAAF